MKSLTNLSKFSAGNHAHEKLHRPDLMTDDDIDKYRVFINKHPVARERLLATYSWLPKITPYIINIINRLYNSTITKFIATSFTTV